MYKKEKGYQTEDPANPGQSRRNYLRRKEIKKIKKIENQKPHPLINP